MEVRIGSDFTLYRIFVLFLIDSLRTQSSVLFHCIQEFYLGKYYFFLWKIEDFSCYFLEN